VKLYPVAVEVITVLVADVAYYGSALVVPLNKSLTTETVPVFVVNTKESNLPLTNARLILELKIILKTESYLTSVISILIAFLVSSQLIVTDGPPV
jgi:hypothetical protein